MKTIIGQHMRRDARDLEVIKADIRTRDNGNQERSATFLPETIDVEKRTVQLAFSSEAEVRRWFGIEILSHRQDAVDMSRMNDSAPLLVGHDWDDQIGVIESASIDVDARGRALVRFGNSPRAQEIFQDVIDGIRKHVSVGYQILDAERTEMRDDVAVWTVTRWQPYEVSMVPIPADTTVGVGRDAKGKPKEGGPEGKPHNSANTRNEPIKVTANMKTITTRDAHGNKVRAKVDDEGNIVEILETIERADDATQRALTQGGDAERSRVSDIMAMGDRFQLREAAAEFIKNGKTVEEFRQHALEAFEKRANTPINDQAATSDVGMSAADVRRFSVVRAVRALMDPTNRRAQEDAAFEFEASRAAADKAGKESKGLMIPTDVLRAAVPGQWGHIGERVISAGTNGQTGAGSTGSETIATTLLAGSFIDVLRNKTTIMRNGRVLGGLVGNIDIPKQTSVTQGYWQGEDDSAQESNIDFGQITLSPKTVAGYADLTRRLMMQSSMDVEALVRADLAIALALALDKAGYYGSGSSFQPLGIANTTGLNSVAFAGTNPTFGELVDMETAIALDNADVDGMRYVGRADLRGYAKQTLKFQAAGSATIWEPGNTINGYGVDITQQITSGDVFFGNFMDLIIGLWGGLDMIIDPYSNSLKGRLRIVVFQDCDFALRRTESFCLGRKATS